MICYIKPGTLVYDKVLRNIGIVVGYTYALGLEYLVYERGGERYWPVRDVELVLPEPEEPE